MSILDPAYGDDMDVTIPRELAEYLLAAALPTGDWACVECRPYSDIVVEGFRCGRHDLAARLSAPTDEGSALDDTEALSHCAGCSGWVSYSSHDEGYKCPGYARAAADTARPGLDVEALTTALANADCDPMDGEHHERPFAEAVAAEYARLTEDRP